MNSKLVWNSLVNASATFIYSSLVAWFLFNANSVFGKVNDFTGPLFMLMLLIISATVTGYFVLGKPVQLYFENHKKEAVKMLFTTLAWLFSFCLVLALALLK
ncbi:MAG: hypothetical protein NTY12_01050 [Candidatus Falkowbacteria bacterium]|nr:hypothetical protein [Candidatus Falkowbacteria bacterium]